jgi:hypothetical protein
MADRCDLGHSDGRWTPATRCTGCGHRVAAPWGSVPIETRRLPVRYWIFELAARYIARHPVQELGKRP